MSVQSYLLFHTNTLALQLLIFVEPLSVAFKFWQYVTQRGGICSISEHFCILVVKMTAKLILILFMPGPMYSIKLNS